MLSINKALQVKLQTTLATTTLPTTICPQLLTKTSSMAIGSISRTIVVMAPEGSGDHMWYRYGFTKLFVKQGFQPNRDVPRHANVSESPKKELLNLIDINYNYILPFV